MRAIRCNKSEREHVAVGFFLPEAVCCNCGFDIRMLNLLELQNISAIHFVIIAKLEENMHTSIDHGYHHVVGMEVDSDRN